MEENPDRIKLNILAINFPADKQREIQGIIEPQGHFVDFCSLADSYSFIIRVFPDYIIAAAPPSGDLQNDKLFSNISKMADDFSLPLIIVDRSLSEKTYTLQINDIVSGIMNSPFGKNFFFKYIDEAIRFLSEHKKVVLHNDSSIQINSLLSELMSQKRLDVDLIPENRVVLQHHDAHQENKEKKDLELRLWSALENNMFRLYYQPVISLADDTISGFEALIRMVDENGAIITPDQFIGAAEESALIFPLGLWIVEETCRQINEWKEKFALDSPLRVNVNLSPRQFIFPNLTSSIFEITEKYDISPADVAFEITESAFMIDMESANIALLEFRSKNFMLYMDDFGTGYSSLSYLMHFPVNVIKIDQSFVKWMHIDEQSEIIVRSVISLAHNLGLKVVAEGTDEPSHVELLKNWECDYAQGYLFAKPLKASDADGFLDKYYRRK